MIHLQAPDYSIPWADEKFINKFGPIEGRKCYEVMHGLQSPCEKCPTFKAFVTKEPVISEWQLPNGQIYMTVTEPLPNDIPLLIETAVEQELPIQETGDSQSFPMRDIRNLPPYIPM